MSQGFSAHFSREEMEAIRKSLRDEAKFGTDFMARLKRVAKRIPFAEDLRGGVVLRARSGNAPGVCG